MMMHCDDDDNDEDDDDNDDDDNDDDDDEYQNDQTYQDDQINVNKAAKNQPKINKTRGIPGADIGSAL